MQNVKRIKYIIKNEILLKLNGHKSKLFCAWQHKCMTFFYRQYFHFANTLPKKRILKHRINGVYNIILINQTFDVKI